MTKRKKTTNKWLSDKLLVSIYNANNYRKIKNFTLSKLGIISVLLIISIFFFILFSLAYFYTPLKYFIPGYPDKHAKTIVYENSLKIDSIILDLNTKEQYLTAIQDFIFNNVTIDEALKLSLLEITPKQIDEFNNPIKTNKEHSHSSKPTYILDSSLVKVSDEETDYSSIQLFPPLKNAIIQSRYNSALKHYGIDLASNDQTIYACLEGTVISSHYAIEAGYTIIIQHNSNLISVYKHNEKHYVNAGDFVSAGQAISRYGFCGEYSNGPHLHFELWKNGKPVNPEDYIQF